MEDVNLLNLSIYHNFGEASFYPDDFFQRTAQLTDYLSHSEYMDLYARRSLNWSMKQFLKLPSWFYKFQLAQKQTRQVKFPTQLLQMRKETNQFKALLHEITDPSPTEARRKDVLDGLQSKNSLMQSSNSPQHFLTQILPFVFHLCMPQVRDVNTQLFNEEEKKAFTAAIELMICLHLRIGYVHEDTQEVRF